MSDVTTEQGQQRCVKVNDVISVSSVTFVARWVPLGDVEGVQDTFQRMVHRWRPLTPGSKLTRAW